MFVSVSQGKNMLITFEAKNLRGKEIKYQIYGDFGNPYRMFGENERKICINHLKLQNDFKLFSVCAKVGMKWIELLRYKSRNDIILSLINKYKIVNVFVYFFDVHKYGLTRKVLKEFKPFYDGHGSQTIYYRYVPYVTALKMNFIININQEYIKALFHMTPIKYHKFHDCLCTINFF